MSEEMKDNLALAKTPTTKSLCAYLRYRGATFQSNLRDVATVWFYKGGEIIVPNSKDLADYIPAMRTAVEKIESIDGFPLCILDGKNDGYMVKIKIEEQVVEIPVVAEGVEDAKGEASLRLDRYALDYLTIKPEDITID